MLIVFMVKLQQAQAFNMMVCFEIKQKLPKQTWIRDVNLCIPNPSTLYSILYKTPTISRHIKQIINLLNVHFVT